MPDDELQLRQKFEAWAESRYPLERSKPADQCVGIDYQWNETEAAWDGYKAGFRHAKE